MYHVTFWMPALVPRITIDLYELLHNCTAAPGAFRRESRRVVVMAIHIVFVLIVRVLRPEKSWTHGASEVLDMVLLIYGVRRLLNKSAKTLEYARIIREHPLQAVI